MKKPEIEVVRFGAEDVIATSGVEWSGVGGTKWDSSVSIGGNTYGQTQGEGYNTSGAAMTALKDYYKNHPDWMSGSPSASNVKFSIGTSSKTLSNLWDDDPGWGVSDDYNGFYTYQGKDNLYYWFNWVRKP